MKLLQKFFKTRRVVYTCLFGYSEQFLNRNYEGDNKTDFICFTDDLSLRSDFWQFRYIDPSLFGAVKTAKRVKILPHRYLSEYESSLYIDNTVELTAHTDIIFNYLGTTQIMVCFRHPDRDCVYDEAVVVKYLGLDSATTVERQMHRYRVSGHPANAGLIAGTILLRRHNNRRVRNVMDAWFQEVRQHSYRDQLSFNVVARRLGFTPEFFPDGTLYENHLMRWPVVSGWRLPRGFRDERYLELNEDVRQSGLNPRKHYVLFGAAEGRPWF